MSNDAAQKSNYYHYTDFLDQCTFAERAKHMEINVRMYGANRGHNNECVGLEYANTKSKFEYEGDAF